jgi:hypothetical protein
MKPGKTPHLLILYCCNMDTMELLQDLRVLGWERSFWEEHGLVLFLWLRRNTHIGNSLSSCLCCAVNAHHHPPEKAPEKTAI